MSASVEWFKEEWLSSDSKALGIYMALLSMRLKYSYLTEYDLKEVLIDFKGTIKKEISKEVEKIAKGEERFDIWDAVDEFIEATYSQYYKIEKEIRTKSCVLTEEGRKALEELEKEYYEKFKNACYKYLNKDIIKKYKKYGKYIARVLRKMRRYGEETSCGSIKLYIIKNAISEILTGRAYKEISEDEKKYIDAIYNFLFESGILWSDCIIPAPYLEDGFIEKLERGEEIIVENEKGATAEGGEEVAIPVKEEGDKSIELYKDKKPSREILESIVANVLERFGFKVETNKMAKTKEGREIEVDVWGVKTIGNTRFYVYASCKNWDRKVDRDVIFSEIGRISNLIQHPHLKIFVCKELTDPARETALTDGFTVIELREKANSENADEIAKIVYKHLNELFTGIAPPELQRIAKEAKAISEKLKSLVDELDKLTKY